MFETTPVLSVSDINTYIKAILTSEEKLKFIRIRGEISNFKAYPSGHFYFSLKDDNSVISAVMFNNYAKKIAFSPKNGDEVVVLASVDAYVPRGSYNLTVFEMESVGQGQLLVELEKLKKKLAAEGLFDESRKRKINIFPKAIGVITAPNGAAVRDIVTNIKRRYPIADIYVFPSLVQGEQAPKELLKAFTKSQEYDLDTLIIGRGGGASEDLSAFNDETLVRAIATSRMPVIAAVGHEIDSTLVDYVADKRASTPTGAAELATVDRREIEKEFAYSLMNMEQALYKNLESKREDVSSLKEELDESIKDKLSDYRDELDNLSKQLEMLNPKSILKRGYSISTNKDGKVITSVNDVKENDIIVTSVGDGQIISNVNKVTKE
ncbi:MAG: exodeoxyribonuclease VII large subunit [Bacilli bacterium]|nr:exodeoxyribonuclease VII large subunit [Bacilli bacterium]